MVTDGEGVRAREAEALARIGAALQSQPTKLTMRLPKQLADVALAAWQRDEIQVPASETAEQCKARHRSATLSLIGLSIESTGRAEGDQIVCELDAWHVGLALEAADESGLFQ